MNSSNTTAAHDDSSSASTILFYIIIIHAVVAAYFLHKHFKNKKLLAAATTANSPQGITTTSSNHPLTSIILLSHVMKFVNPVRKDQKFPQHFLLAFVNAFWRESIGYYLAGFENLKKCISQHGLLSSVPQNLDVYWMIAYWARAGGEVTVAPDEIGGLASAALQVAGLLVTSSAVKSPGIPFRTLQQIQQRYSNDPVVVSIKPSNFLPVNFDTLRELFAAFPYLVSINISHCTPQTFNVGFLYGLKSFPTLRKLKLSMALFYDKMDCVATLATLTFLEELEFTGHIDCLPVLAPLVNLKRFSVNGAFNDESMIFIGDSFKNLRELFLAFCGPNITDQGFRHVAENCKSLVKLSLGGATPFAINPGDDDEKFDWIKTPIFQIISEQMPQLEHLELFHCKHACDDDIQLLQRNLQLRFLTIQNCPRISESGVKFLESCLPRLEFADLRGDSVSDEERKKAVEQLKRALTLLS